jgi:peptidoglycan-associated lipoprotein
MKLILPILITLFSLSACSYTLKVNDGRTAHGLKYYAKAAPMLEKEFRGAKSRVEKGKLAFLIADCQKQTGHYAEAIKWYQTAYDNSYGTASLMNLAFMLKQTEQYTEAQDAFKQLGLEIGSQYQYRKDITACTVAATWKKQLDSTEWQVTPAHFNTAAHEFCPVLAPDGRLVFSSDRPNNLSKKNYAWTGSAFMDLYIVDRDAASPQFFDQRLSTEHHEAALCFGRGGQELWFTRSVPSEKGDIHYLKIFYAQKTENGWSLPEPLAFQKEQFHYTHPAISPDGKTLYFASTDGSWGGYDICYANRTADGYAEYKPLGRVVNTAGNDAFPVWNNDTLYFSSTEHTGMGGLDIFKTWKIGENAWASPQNLKAPINSGSDDFSFVVEQSNPEKNLTVGTVITEAFFASNRPNGRGGDDIYKVTQRVPKVKPPESKPDTVATKPTKGKLILDVFVLEKIYADVQNPNSAVLGRKPISGSQIAINLDGKDLGVQALAEGVYSKEVQINQAYSFKAMADGFLAGTGRTSTAGFSIEKGGEQHIEVEIVLDRIFRNKEITLDNIYYDYDRAEIRTDAEPTLIALAETLVENPQINIQLGSHTDCRGNDRYNQELSQRRAQSAVNYLIAKGIDPKRLSAVGYGESVPTAACVCQSCLESEHQLNRRTTFKILE